MGCRHLLNFGCIYPLNSHKSKFAKSKDWINSFTSFKLTIPDRGKIELNWMLTVLCGTSKGFIDEAFIKRLELPQRSMKIKTYVTCLFQIMFFGC